MKIIEVEKLSKKYTLRENPKANTLRDLILNIKNFSNNQAGKKEEVLWALREINFDVAEGETVALIGNNGAGKSTLLKILSRIIKPTSGEAVLRGRTGSLLEVGTGFHRELTGRENVFLNGAVLGMKRAEISKKFDEIVAFSELEKFLDTPIKFYSTGMYMRLAFAVAAHLEPEILMVDEVLAVGDLAFQRKCLSKMREVSEHGRTIVFVSHNMQAVTRLCSRAIWLENGVIKEDAAAKDVVSNYLNSQTETSSQRHWENLLEAPGNNSAKLRGVRVFDKNDNGNSAFDIRFPVYVEMTYEILQEEQILMPGFQLFNEENICIFTSKDLNKKWRNKIRPKGIYTSRVEIPSNFLAEGNFYVSVSLTTYEPLNVHFNERDVVAFLITDTIEGNSARGDFAGRMEGIVRPILNWETILEASN
ncbi:MAG: ABC transporter ATP-binding protein [Acidobacteriota bacterium]|jgi:lipopolysaccharide transport system ATP-binding protein|nr:ABC transporter ATP-binding protein [Acidobacteriota bacterium]